MFYDSQKLWNFSFKGTITIYKSQFKSHSFIWMNEIIPHQTPFSDHILYILLVKWSLPLIFSSHITRIHFIANFNVLNFFLSFFSTSIIFPLSRLILPHICVARNSFLHGLPVLHHLIFQFILQSATWWKYHCSHTGALLTKLQ